MQRTVSKLIYITLLLTIGSWHSANAQSGPLVQKPNLQYQGSFKLPNASGNGFAYGGTALAYNPANDSIFIVGHTYDQMTAEVKIPSLGGTGTLLQPLAGLSRLGAIGTGTHIIGGNLVYEGKLYTSAFLFYDATGSQTSSHYTRSSLNLAGSTTTGPVRVGSMGAGYYSGYMGIVPSEWRAKFGGPAITGNCCLSIISRTSYGPALFAFDPQNMGSAKPLVYYTQNNQTLGTYGASGVNPIFNGTTRITGVVFPNGTSSVLFFGMTGVGKYCYGEASSCGDPSNSSKGEHAYPYKAYVWAYDANDLAAVSSGSKQPWSVKPYATWELSELGSVSSDFGVAGATYDPTGGRIFISKKFGDGEKPLVYVYKVDNSVTVQKPMAPTSLSAN